MLVCAQTPCTRMCPIRPAAALCSLTPWGPFVPDSQALEPLNLMLLPHLMRVGKVGWKSGPLSVCVMLAMSVTPWLVYAWSQGATHLDPAFLSSRRDIFS